ncbi:MAG: hypothetical protein H7243_02015, partial [Sphingomonadaceae bacterium]|nr:hypothetical protein [Sphingomonadaceae bacterium]
MRSFLLLTAAVVLAAPLAAAPPPPTYGTFGFDTGGMNRAVTPGTDFGRFANG